MENKPKLEREFEKDKQTGELIVILKVEDKEKGVNKRYVDRFSSKATTKLLVTLSGDIKTHKVQAGAIEIKIKAIKEEIKKLKKENPLTDEQKKFLENLKYVQIYEAIDTKEGQLENDEATLKYHQEELEMKQENYKRMKKVLA